MPTDVTTLVIVDGVGFHAAVRTILRGFDEGVFVRSITNDHDPAWAINLLPFIQALAVARQVLERETRGDL